jgi:para-aminobenzoate synthetase / 4-amino-4-deoxychorismate lyase
MRPDPAQGVYDTLLVRHGRPVDADAHLQRLSASVRVVYGVPVDTAALRARVVAAAAPMTTARLRTSYDPGDGSWQVRATAVEEPGLDPRTLVLRRTPGGLGAHKWCDRALVTGPEHGADDVLLVDEAGLVLECGSANVFAVLPDGTVVTPPLDGRILPGTVRARVLAELRRASVPVSERPVDLEELTGATEVFTTSSIRGVQPVAACVDVARWPCGPVTERLRAAANA